MDVSLITAATGTKAGAAQEQIATTMLKNSADAERSAVMTLLGDAIQNGNSLANVPAGVGGKVNVTA